MSPNSKRSVLILGATGVVGQTYIRLLKKHPFFEIAYLAASYQSIGKTCEISGMQLIAPDAYPKVDIVFSALKESEAKEIEETYAKKGAAVFSHAAFFRSDPTIPVLIPEINPAHLSWIPRQQKEKGWKGFLVSKPNCSLQSYLLPLYPLHQAFGLKHVAVTMLQSRSGGGKGFALENNILPYIPGEEEKSEQEPLKILEAAIPFSLHCNRVPIDEGHLACVSASFEKPLTIEEVLEKWEMFKGLPQELALPTAPKKPLHYLTGLDHPQPLLHKNLEKGMAVVIGQLRQCSLFDLRFTSLSHNLVRGAAGGSLLSAELAYKKGYI